MDPIRIQVQDSRLMDPMYALNYATAGSAAIDIRACGVVNEEGDITPIIEPFPLHWRKVAMVSAGFRMALSPGTAAMILPRSGLAAKQGLVLANDVGLIDEDYRGDVTVALTKRVDGVPFIRFDDHIMIEPMMRIAQMIIIPIYRPDIEYMHALEKTGRNGGFGSTGTL